MYKAGKLTVLAVASGLALSACSPAQEQPSTETAVAASATETVSETTTVEKETDAEGVLQLENGTIRAKQAADQPEGKNMTGLFGTLHNTSDADVQIVGFETSLGEAAYEIHEVVDGVMQEKVGGITIPAGGTHELKPGGDHFMIMNYDPEIPAGDVVDVTLITADGQKVSVSDVAVRSMLPGDEDYGADGSLQGHHTHH